MVNMDSKIGRNDARRHFLVSLLGWGGARRQIGKLQGDKEKERLSRERKIEQVYVRFEKDKVRCSIVRKY